MSTLFTRLINSIKQYRIDRDRRHTIKALEKERGRLYDMYHRLYMLPIDSPHLLRGIGTCIVDIGVVIENLTIND